MQLANPIYLIYLIVVPIYIGFLYYKRRKREAIQISVFSDLKKAQNSSWIKYFPILRHILIILIITFFSISLSRPQNSHEKINANKKGIDIIIALDVSESMLAEDLKPNRIEAAKVSINEFISNIESDRLGIIVFSGVAFTQSPLTFDYSILKEYLTQISTKSINQNVHGLNGTAIGDAILAAVNRFRKSEDRSRVLVLLTDGNANTGADPFIAAQKAKEEGIKIYTIGIGKEGGAPLPITNRFGQKDIARNRDGSIIMATFKEDDLKKIADIGDGRYFRASDNLKFKQIMREINLLEKQDIETEVSTEYTQNFMPFLFTLFILFFIYIVLNGLKAIKI